ncbi:MAG TPA: protein translocase subunit SecF [Chloroflexota bacterium]|nr:protein translocase subunit SecF [Chloroflexota bacterium]
MLNIVGKRYWYFALSLLIIIPGIIAMAISWSQHGSPVALGTDFTGGTEITFTIPQQNQGTKISSVVGSVTGTVNYVQPVISNNCCTYIARTHTITIPEYQKIKDISAKTWKTGGPTQQTTTSGTIASSLTSQAIIAVIVAAIAILLYISFAFRHAPNPFRFGTAAVIAMLHDVLVVLGLFSILGLIAHVEIDATFVTAMLTIIGFSVHDTIVIFDRIRENLARRTDEPFATVVNHSILQSFVRSINTSFTVVLTLLAVFLFTGESIRYFVLAMLIGIISGTYSSIFNASQILVVWHNHELRRLFSRHEEPVAA